MMTQTNNEVLSGTDLALFILDQIVDQVLHCRTYPQDRTASIDEYPFVSYTIATPETDTTGDWLGNNKQYVVTTRLDCHAKSQRQARHMSEALYDALHDPNYKRYFKQVLIVPQTLTNTGNRTVLQDQNLDQDFGFDCSFCITTNRKHDVSKLNFNYEDYDITSVHAEQSNAGTSFDARKEN